MLYTILNPQDFAANYWVELGAPKEKLILGMPVYGRGFTLEDTSQTGMAAPASGPSIAGPWTREAGYFSYYEVLSTNCYDYACHKVI